MSSRADADADANASPSTILCHADPDPDLDPDYQLSDTTTNNLTVQAQEGTDGNSPSVEVFPPFTFDRVSSLVSGAITRLQREGKISQGEASSLTPHLSYRDSEGDLITVSSEREFREMLRLRESCSTAESEPDDAEYECVMVNLEHSFNEEDCRTGTTDTYKNGATDAQHSSLSLWLTLDQATPLYEAVKSDVDSYQSVSPHEDDDAWIRDSDDHYQTPIDSYCTLTSRSIRTFGESVMTAWKQVLIQTRSGWELWTSLVARMGFAQSIGMKSFQYKWNLVSLLSISMLLLLVLRVMFAFSCSNAATVSTLHSNEPLQVISQLQEEIQVLKQQIVLRDASMQPQIVESSCSSVSSEFLQPLTTLIQFGWLDQTTFAQQFYLFGRASRTSLEGFLSSSSTSVRDRVRAAQQTLIESICLVTDAITRIQEQARGVDLAFGFHLPSTAVTIWDQWWEVFQEFPFCTRIQQSFDVAWQYSRHIAHLSKQQDVDMGCIIDRLLTLWNTPIFVFNSDSE